VGNKNVKCYTIYKQQGVNYIFLNNRNMRK
jgi:hypothetical protein